MRAVLRAQRAPGHSYVRFSSKLRPLDNFIPRHNGPKAELEQMCKTIGVESVDALVTKTVPANIRLNRPLNVGEAQTEGAFLANFKKVASKNKVMRSYIGMGYYGTVLPNVILRNLIENPLWYTPYTPYQAEMAQGRLESLMNYQTAVTDLTGMFIANASLLDEATSAAEAMTMAYANAKQKKKGFFVDADTHPQTIQLVKTRAEPWGIEVHVGDYKTFDPAGKDIMGALVSYPASSGKLNDYKDFSDKVHAEGGLVTVATDLLALASLAPPSEFGADIVFGNSQRFGVPLGYGGPHAAFFATTDALKRRMPGRIIGVSKDATGQTALRMALQTREQHIKREKATSNVCTAQALLANTAAMYALYHGPEGIKGISARVHLVAGTLDAGLQRLGYTTSASAGYFDTLTVDVDDADVVCQAAVAKGINLRKVDSSTIGLSMDETVSSADLSDLFAVFAECKGTSVDFTPDELAETVPEGAGLGQFARSGPILEHPIFSAHKTEHNMLRYMHRLASKDITMAHSMYPLGSCTMKLNATSEMIPITWPELNSIHPFAPVDQAQGYKEIFEDLDEKLSEITGFDKVSLQPNSGAQGEYTGLRVIQAYHASIGEAHRDVCLIPVSAHGTNPASAAMCNMKVVSLKVRKSGEIDFDDLSMKVDKYADRLSSLMVTYPSTYGIFDDNIKDICDKIHSVGGQIYLDGANMNAQVGLCRPGDIGADVCHLNLHKTFCIPHGGGGPGMGPIGVAKHLSPFLPNHPVVACSGEQGMGAVAAAPWSSASILPISYAYINMMGSTGLKEATERAIMNANYMMARLEGHYKVLFKGTNGFCAHEFILDLSAFKKSAGVEPGDVAKRLMDFGFHAPTMQFPVIGTLMIEPTESETKDELDRYCDALIKIREEIADVEEGRLPRDNNPLKHSPHTADVLTREEWDRPYSRQQGCYPLPWVATRNKFWPAVSRVDDVYGDLNLICSCPPMEEMEDLD